MGNMPATPIAGVLLHGCADARSGCVGVDRKEHEPAVRHVGGVDARIGADEAVARLADHDAAVHAHKALRLTQDDFDVPGVLVARLRQLDREGGGLDRVEVDATVLGLGDGLLGNDERVVVLQGDTLCGSSAGDEAPQVVTGVDFGDAFDA
jgi:hypothetical protein